jgi:uncharacterized protein YcbK (DUF882 family)
MGDLSEHFDRSEFACRGSGCCGGSAPVLSELIAALEEFRAEVGWPLVILSGFRCRRHNARVPGSSGESLHCLGAAADVARVEGMSVDAVAAAAARCSRIWSGGIGLYDWGVHVDVGVGGPRRWDNRT